MTKEQFSKLVENRLLFLDGATGSNLQKRGMPSGVCPELWICENKEVLIGLQKEYVQAGSNIVYAPTFSANRIKLAGYGLEGRVEELNRTLVSISKEAVGEHALVAGDLTMTGELLAPVGMLAFEDLIDIYKEQITCLVNAGVDLLIVETMMSLQECRAALIAAKETVPDLPVMVTMTFEESGRTLYGTDAKTAAIVLESLGADAIGVNCSTGPEKMVKVVESMAAVTRVPLIAKPNAGLPKLNEQGQTVYEMDAEEFGRKVQMLVEAGASVLGGCCGTTPEHIMALTRSVHKTDSLICRRKDRDYYLTSERQTVSFGLDGEPILVGERINPSGKSEMQEELLNEEFYTIEDMAQEQEEDDAAVLDLNCSMPGIDEQDILLKAMDAVAGVTKMPLALDSGNPAVLEAALRKYPGRALLNSAAFEGAKFDRLLDAAVKYGAMVVLMPMTEKGLPRNLAEKKEIAAKMVEAALTKGLKKEDIAVDALTTSVAISADAALETVDMIRFIKDLGVAAICGISNISYAMPQRCSLNAAFYQMASDAGLNLAIANPGQKFSDVSEIAQNALLGDEEAILEFIQNSRE